MRILIALLTKYETFTLYMYDMCYIPTALHCCFSTNSISVKSSRDVTCTLLTHAFLTNVVHVHFLKYNEEYIAQIPNGYVRYEVTNWI